MPDMTFEVSDEQLFPDDDPLTITIRGRADAEDGTPEAGGTFRCLDRANPPLERDHDPSAQPSEYVVALLVGQLVEDQRDTFEAAAVSAIRDAPPRILVGDLIKTARWITEQRQEAEKAALARAVDRPTKARRASTR